MMNDKIIIKQKQHEFNIDEVILMQLCKHYFELFECKAMSSYGVYILYAQNMSATCL